MPQRTGASSGSPQAPSEPPSPLLSLLSPKGWLPKDYLCKLFTNIWTLDVDKEENIYFRIMHLDHGSEIVQK